MCQFIRIDTRQCTSIHLPRVLVVGRLLAVDNPGDGIALVGVWSALLVHQPPDDCKGGKYGQHFIEKRSCILFLVLWYTAGREI